MAQIAWVQDPFELVFGQGFNPFASHLTPAERLNAHARLVLLIGGGLALVSGRERAPLILLVTVLYVIGEGVRFTTMLTTTQQRKEISAQEHKSSMADDPSRSKTPQPNAQMKNRLADAFVPLPTGVDPSVVQYNSATLISEAQQQYMRHNYDMSRRETHFDTQNRALQLGGMATTAFSSSFAPSSQLGSIHPNPGPFDYGTAVNSVNPAAYTHEADWLGRMMRSPDEVDVELVTNPLPDPTFMARMPTFDKTYEYEAEQRWRMQRNGAFRFW